MSVALGGSAARQLVDDGRSARPRAHVVLARTHGHRRPRGAEPSPRGRCGVGTLQRAGGRLPERSVRVRARRHVLPASGTEARRERASARCEPRAVAVGSRDGRRRLAGVPAPRRRRGAAPRGAGDEPVRLLGIRGGRPGVARSRAHAHRPRPRRRACRFRDRCDARIAAGDRPGPPAADALARARPARRAIARRRVVVLPRVDGVRAAARIGRRRVRRAHPDQPRHARAARLGRRRGGVVRHGRGACLGVRRPRRAAGDARAGQPVGRARSRCGRGRGGRAARRRREAAPEPVADHRTGRA